MLPNDGVGLARMEFIISEQIGVHPMALANPKQVTATKDRNAIARPVRHYSHPQNFFIEKLSEGIGTIAAAFYPKPVIVRLSDFKTNEYTSLIGGAGFEPREANPMIGCRGASRYAHPAYVGGFALECAALRRVRNDMGLTNLRVMVPFCRRVEEGRRVIETMASHGLKQGENGLEIYVIVRSPTTSSRSTRSPRCSTASRSAPTTSRSLRWVSTAIPKSSPSTLTNAIPACWRCCAWR
jgi:pyruvate,water dikinase